MIFYSCIGSTVSLFTSDTAIAIIVTISDVFYFPVTFLVVLRLKCRIK